MFLISQPRAGSTLLQRVLGSHPDIHTAAEPWLMLHPLYALRSEGYEAEYQTTTARRALRGFLEALPGGEEEYVEGVRRMCAYLYQRALAASGKRYFLDKTPRYYFVIPELYRTFPEAHYIILLRNPLAVLCSVLKSWVREDWLGIYRFKDDLTRAPRLLLEGIELLGARAVVVHYERMVNDPEGETQRVCSRLGIDFSPAMIDYGHSSLPRWRFGDQETVYQHARPAPQCAGKWAQALEEPQVWRLADDYLELLGSETVEQMGYSHQELRHAIESRRPARARLRFTFSLGWLLRKPPEQRSRWVRDTVRLRGSLRCRGLRGTVVALTRRAAHALSNPE